MKILNKKTKVIERFRERHHRTHAYPFAYSHAQFPWLIKRYRTSFCAYVKDAGAEVAPQAIKGSDTMASFLCHAPHFHLVCGFCDKNA
jgi:hypothetical protein